MGSFAMALEFAVAAMSTGGLQGLATESDGQIEDARAIFCGIYVLVGVPIFGQFLGKFATLLVSQYIEASSHESEDVEESAHVDTEQGRVLDDILAKKYHCFPQ